MANVTKIKFQYFKQLEKGTTEYTTSEERKAGTGGHRRAGHPRVGPRRRGPWGGAPVNGEEGKGRVLAGGAPFPPWPAATPGLPGRPVLESRVRRTSAPRTPGPRCPRLRQAAKSRRSRCVLHCHRDPTRQQRLPRERPSAPGARGKSPSAPMNKCLPHDGHAQGRGFPPPLPSSGNPL